MSNNITLEQSLQAYRVMNTPSKFSWKQHWANETFSHTDALMCDEAEKSQFNKRLKECHITICPNIKAKEGEVYTLDVLINTIISLNNKNINKSNRKVIYSTSDGIRPIGKESFNMWNGFQVIDMDIKNTELAQQLKQVIFDHLCNCNWFLGVTLSSSGNGLHVYTKIAIPQSDQDDHNRKKLLYMVNFRHKYSFVYLSCLSYIEEMGYTKEDLQKWMDFSMFKPQQGAFIGYDSHPLINTKFFEDFIYVNFDNVESTGHPDIDWVTHPDLKAVFKRWEWFEEENSEESLNIQVTSAEDLKGEIVNKIHYKHFERWRLANTLVKIYGLDKGFKYLRMICSNNIKDKELQADCITASRHDKPVDVWAVNRLNNQHGFNIKLNIQDESFDEAEIFNSMDKIDNPTLIRESKYLKVYNIKANQYLGDIRHNILDDLGRITLLEAGAGVGKTEMVKQIVRDDGKKIIMVMPFTSTIKAKVENDDDWYFSYGNRKPNLDVSGGLALTIDKFSHLNLMDIKAAGFNYIFIDESHLMFQSEYRPVMAKVIEMIRNTEMSIILMSGTPSGELVFFPDIVHIKVIKEDLRKKEMKVNLVDSSSDLIYHMCQQMANDIASGKRILFPTNQGTIYSKQVEAAVTYFLNNEHLIFEPVRLKYYKKSNIGEQFMDDVNFEKTVADTQILLCTNYLSVGVDILDKYNFSIYFADLMMPQEVEQFANRLRSNDLYINLYVAKNDADGNSRSIHKYKEMNFKLNADEIKNVHSILRLCNAMIERNPIEYKYNSLISSIISDNKFIEYDDIENRYYLNEIAYKVIYFERKYREYVQQLPVLMKGMKSYGYQISSVDLQSFSVTGSEMFRDLKNMVKLAHDDQLVLNTTNIEELMDIITEDRLSLYKEVLSGKFDIRKGKEWKEDLLNNKMFVKNIEVFEKVVPIFISLSKRYPVDSIKEIFYHCRNKNGSYNFAAINRVRLLTNIIYNDNNKRLDIPIKEFMKEAYEFSDKALVNKVDIQNFLNDFSRRYAQRESTGLVLIDKSELTMLSMHDIFEKIFKCLIKTSRPSKDGLVTMERVELLWPTRDYYNNDMSDKLFFLEEFLGADINSEIVECEAPEPEG